MSFFGFDPSRPPPSQRQSHNNAAPGFTQPRDAFASFQDREQDGDGDELDFEDTYDGLGDQLDESGDTFNDDTFGGEGPVTQKSVGKDFDFFGQTNRYAGTIQEEQMTYNMGQASRPPPGLQNTRKPARTGYEGYIPQLQANASIWGAPAKQTPEPSAHLQQASMDQPCAGSARKHMTLEEIEAQMRAPPQPSSRGGPSHESPRQMPGQPQMQYQQGQMQQPYPPFGFPGPGFPPHMGMHPSPQQQMAQMNQMRMMQQQQFPGGMSEEQIQQMMRGQQPQFQGQMPQRPRQDQQQPLARGQTPLQRDSPAPPQDRDEQSDSQPRQILQNPNRLAGHGMPMAPPPQGQQQGPPLDEQMGPGHQRGPSYTGPIITSPAQILNLSSEDRAAFLEEEARRAKRNHKIASMAKFNALMTPQDKNYISRIQLTQLMSASGTLEDQSIEAKLNEDFYYQVHSQIRAGSRINPNQPANAFAQTYLFQTGNRYGGGRRFHRNGDNHMQRMQQQVQRAVEAAKSKPKNKSLNFEGSLGTIAFSNSKAPRPMLSIKAAEEGLRPPTAGRRPSRIHDAAAERRAALKNIENTFRSLMLMEDHERNRPPRLHEGAPAALIQAHMDWREKLGACNQQLWSDLKVMEPVQSNSPSTHPFIALLSFAKGKKLIPRVWRHIDDQQRLTIITLIAVHIDSLDVVAHTIPSLENPSSPSQPPLAVREEIDLFNTTIIPTFFVFLNEAQLPIIIGLLGLILDRSTITNLVRTKSGISILTMLISRVELIKSSSTSAPTDQQPTPQDLEQWSIQYNRLFDSCEPALPYLFGAVSVHESDDVHIWQFLAAMGAAASPEQQQRLVIGVKERVMETVGVSRSLPVGLQEVRLGHVNLFMRAIGLDVELLG